MPFTYYPPPKDGSEIFQEELEHKYYVQLTPDGHHLVPGMLQQDIQPEIGKWMFLGKIDRHFAKRYFVQYTDFNTLVPGSVISATKLPEGKWKEIKPVGLEAFHRVVFREEDRYEVDGDISEETIFTDNTEFINNKLIDVLNVVLPGKFNSINYATAYFSYFAGSFAELNSDPTQLISFGAPPAYFSIYYTLFGEYSNISNTTPGAGDLRIQPETPNGTYSIILAVPRNLPFTFTVFTDYIVLENILTKADSAS